jgi:hypothetical protein
MPSHRTERGIHIVAWALLALAFLLVSYGFVSIIPHAYASRGLGLFLIVAVPIAMFLREWRRRWHAIGWLAGLITAGVVTLHVMGTNTITIENRSGQTVKDLIVVLPDGGAFSLAGLRDGQTVKARFQDLRFKGGIEVFGELSDGTRFPDTIRQPFGGMLFNPRGRLREVQVVIGVSGIVQVAEPDR